jgi:ribonuclease P protein component
MLPAANRMRTAADFSETTRRGTKVSRGRVVVYLNPAVDRSSAPLVGLVVGKVVGGSVQRHRAARRLRGALAPLIPELPVGSRVVVRALAGADTDPDLGEQVRAGLLTAIERVRGS